MAPSLLHSKIPPKPKKSLSFHTIICSDKRRSQRSNPPSSPSAPASAFASSPPPPSASPTKTLESSTAPVSPPPPPWIQQWDPAPAPPLPEKPKPASSIERIVHRLRNLELGLDEVELREEESGQLTPLNGDERLGELLERGWVRPDLPSNVHRVAPLPCERGGEEDVVGEKETVKKRRVKAPTLAELTIEDEELRRLRRMGMTLRERGLALPRLGSHMRFLRRFISSGASQSL